MRPAQFLAGGRDDRLGRSGLQPDRPDSSGAHGLGREETFFVGLETEKVAGVVEVADLPSAVRGVSDGPHSAGDHRIEGMGRIPFCIDLISAGVRVDDAQRLWTPPDRKEGGGDRFARVVEPSRHVETRECRERDYI